MAQLGAIQISYNATRERGKQNRHISVTWVKGGYEISL